MFPNAVLIDQETQGDTEIYSVAEAKRKLSAQLGRYRDGQIGMSVEEAASASGEQRERDAESAQYLELYRCFALSTWRKRKGGNAAGT